MDRELTAGRTNERLAAARNAREWDQADVAAAVQNLEDELGGKGQSLGIDAHQVSRWELGRRSPSLDYQARLCLVFESEPAELGFKATPQLVRVIRKLRMELMNRRQLLKGMGGVLAGVLVDPDQLAAALSAPRKVDRVLLDGLERQTCTFVHLLDKVPPKSFLQVVCLHLSELRSLMAGTQSTRLLELASQTALLAGWLSYRLDNNGNTRSYWSYASELASEIHCTSVMAHAQGSKSFLYSEVMNRGAGDSRSSLALLDYAISVAGKHTKPALRSWLHARRSEERAATGDRTGARHDIDVARSAAASTANDVDALRFLDDWHTGRLLRYHGSSAELVGDYSLAATVLEEGLKKLDPTFLPHRAIMLTHLATVYAKQQRNPDHACELLNEAIGISQQTDQAEAMRRILHARRHLQEWADLPSVRRLEERLRISV